MVKSFLKLVETDSVIEIHVEAAEGLGEALVLFANFYPEQVQNLLNWATLDIDFSGCGTPVHIGGENVPHVCTFITGVLLLLLRQVKEQIIQVV